MRLASRFLGLLIGLALMGAGSPPPSRGAETAETPDPGGGPAACILRIQGPIGPAIADFIEKSLEPANLGDTALIILEIDTPGGLSDSMRVIIRAILDAPAPVAGYVYPSGSRAASAGTYILYACHIAAMAPGTNLGAATPVQIGGGGLPLPQERKPNRGEDREADPGDAPSGDAMTAKMVNDAAAYIRSLAEMRGRNAEWAERAVREGVSLPVNEALEKGVIDLIAEDAADLLRRIDGREVRIGDRRVTLRTAGLAVRSIEPDWRTRLLAILTNPNIAFILVLVGVYGLIFEFAHPGTFGPGIAGGICLLMAFYGLSVLPLNHAGLMLLLLAIALMAAEAFVPSFGVLGVGGIVAFVLAATMLFDTDIPGFGISWPVIGGAALVSGLLLIFLLGYVWRAQRRPITTGSEGLIGREAVVLSWAGSDGYVRLGGERWRAASHRRFTPGERVMVIRRTGLVLEVAGAPQTTNERR